MVLSVIVFAVDDHFDGHGKQPGLDLEASAMRSENLQGWGWGGGGGGGGRLGGLKLVRWYKTDGPNCMSNGSPSPRLLT